MKSKAIYFSSLNIMNFIILNIELSDKSCLFLLFSDRLSTYDFVPARLSSIGSEFRVICDILPKE